MLALVALTLLHGVVRIGPTTPVCRAGIPCSKPAAGATLTFARGPVRMHARTGADGRYRIRLAPGTWRVTASTGMRTSPAVISVPRAPAVVRNFTIDTGIR